jgi:coenzyme PQQ synthesis protein D (PqqD)
VTGPAAVRFRPSPDALATRVGDEIVLVHTRTDQIYVLNRTGARIWELLCEDCDRDEVERRLAGEFEVPAGELTGQVDDLIASLTTGHLIAARGDD